MLIESVSLSTSLSGQGGGGGKEVMATPAPAPSLQPSGLHTFCCQRARAGLHSDAAGGGFLSARPGIAALLLGAAVLVLLAGGAAPVPGATVYRVWPSGACRSVVTVEGLSHGCANLPRLHHVVWVSPAWNGDPAATGEALTRAAPETAMRNAMTDTPG